MKVLNGGFYDITKNDLNNAIKLIKSTNETLITKLNPLNFGFTDFTVNKFYFAGILNSY
jgi:hypothetical protein